jgi:hypothetical protein
MSVGSAGIHNLAPGSHLAKVESTQRRGVLLGVTLYAWFEVTCNQAFPWVKSERLCIPWPSSLLRY